MGFVVSKGARLLGGPLGSCNNVLLLNGLNPEARRIIGQVRYQGHKRPARVNGVPALENLAVEMRNDRDEQIRGMFTPVLLEETHHRSVEETDRKLKHTKEILAAEGPAVLQDDVVLLLNADPCQFTEDI